MSQIDVEKVNSFLSTIELLISLIREELNSNKEYKQKENIVDEVSAEYVTPYSDDYDEVFSE